MEVFRQIVNVGGPHLFVQLVHNTDSDTLFLVIIKNFSTFEIEEVDFTK